PGLRGDACRGRRDPGCLDGATTDGGRTGRRRCLRGRGAGRDRRGLTDALAVGRGRTGTDAGPSAPVSDATRGPTSADPRRVHAVQFRQASTVRSMSTSTCELCAADRMTTWWFDDDLCWVAECDACGVPMVVWKVHDPDPPPDVKAELWDRLRTVA